MFKWLFSKLLKRKYITGIDLGNGTDYGCKTEGYRDSKGVAHITKVTYMDRKG
ncbi:MAG: hypothetical protein N2513_10500 [Deltaproteobacteria bacterium]|nr:hypothetical protein [Deltaproteobacteria bacterium]